MEASTALQTASDTLPIPRVETAARQETHSSAPCLLGYHQAAWDIFACRWCWPSLSLSRAAAVLTWPGGTGKASICTPEEPYAATAVLQLGQPWQGVGALQREDQRIRGLWDREGMCTRQLRAASVAAAEPARGMTVWGQRLAQPSLHSSPLGHSRTGDVD